MVVDECHRGYLLDREMSDMEMSFRSEADYISKYRRVLEHFDAVKIGLTATPALHTTQIFGEPIFTYSYPIAGWGDPLDKLMAPAPHEQAERCCNVR
jgi:type I restriction enzyme, R subunit